MNTHFLPIAICFSILLFSACGGRKQTDTQATHSTTSTAISEATTEVEIIGHLVDLGLTSDSDWRGINLGDEFTKVKGIEKGDSLERDANHIGYTIGLQHLESADMLYYQTNKKVSAINVDLFLNKRQSVTDYQKDLESYFTARYGAPQPGDGGTIWKGQKGHTVSLKDVSKGKDFGLKIKIGSSTGASTVSTK